MELTSGICLGLGVCIPLLLWGVQRDLKNRVSFQALAVGKKYRWRDDLYTYSAMIKVVERQGFFIRAQIQKIILQSIDGERLQVDQEIHFKEGRGDRFALPFWRAAPMVVVGALGVFSLLFTSPLGVGYLSFGVTLGALTAGLVNAAYVLL